MSNAGVRGSNQSSPATFTTIPVNCFGGSLLKSKGGNQHCNPNKDKELDNLILLIKRVLNAKGGHDQTDE